MFVLRRSNANELWDVENWHLVMCDKGLKCVI